MMENNSNSKTELVLATLYKKESDPYKGEYFLRLEYNHEDEFGIYRIIYPRVSMMCIPKYRLPTIEKENFIDCTKPAIEGTLFLNLGSERHALLPDKNGEYEYKTLIEPKVHELTVEEIEKKLGYKIKIIGNEEKEYE